MAEIINLREFRKNKERSAKSSRASQNRAKFGRSKIEKARERDTIERANADIDGKKLELDETDQPTESN